MHTSLKQQAVIGVQASETALEAAHDIERSLCFVNPTTEQGGHCTNAIAATVGLTDAKHQQLATLFAKAFATEIKASIALQAWNSGQPAPTNLVEYKADVDAVLNLARQLVTGQAQSFIDKAQAAVDEAAKIITIFGGK
jgi:hypothetical protein